MKNRLALLAFSSFALVGFSYAQTGLGTAQSFNVFVFGNGSASGGDTEGAVAVGGSFTTFNAHATLNHNYPATVGATSGIGLYVGGSMSVNGGQLNQGGLGLIGGSFTASNIYNLNAGAKLRVGGSVSGTVQPNANVTANVAPNPVDLSVFSAQQAWSNTQTAFLHGLSAYDLDAAIVDQNNHSINVGAIPDAPGYA